MAPGTLSMRLRRVEPQLASHEICQMAGRGGGIRLGCALFKSLQEVRVIQLAILKLEIPRIVVDQQGQDFLCNWHAPTEARRATEKKLGNNS